ncbi:hypothetical protein DCCM_3702 [Desulfocucumis palustris]|uniref:SLH domain-containing protein n=1 Tax=Desulfocucumis palustris TaxID=1898651 RepID=A0A2L2XFU7_9FIRM|nr:S-layer homology domain-containing protein [Desulfocucumis palustris]GBF34583.1 hypothetical protein DCCM_3702 [Desulfocucumis palustris]
MKLKKFLLLTAFLCLCLLSRNTAEAVSFSDVPQQHWAAGTIKTMVEKELLSGYPDGTFRPEKQVSRAEFAAILIKAAGINTQAADKSSFADVAEGSWYLPTVETAKKFFNTDTSPGGLKFRPEEPVLREEAAAALSRAKGLSRLDDEQAMAGLFSDYNQISPKYRPDILPAVKSKLILGYQDGSFKPRLPLTRAEAASLIYRAFLYSPSLESWISNGVIKPLAETEKDYQPLTKEMNSNFGSIAVNHSPVKVEFFAGKLDVDGGSDRMIYIFARIDPLKYFTFSEADFGTKPEAVKEFTNNVALWASKSHPGEKVLVVLGYSNLIYYNPESIFDNKYVAYVPDQEGWHINRLYTGAVARNNSVLESWREVD